MAQVSSGCPCYLELVRTPGIVCAMRILMKRCPNLRQRGTGKQTARSCCGLKRLIVHATRFDETVKSTGVNFSAPIS